MLSHPSGRAPVRFVLGRAPHGAPSAWSASASGGGKAGFTAFRAPAKRPARVIKPEKRIIDDAQLFEDIETLLANMDDTGAAHGGSSLPGSGSGGPGEATDDDAMGGAPASRSPSPRPADGTMTPDRNGASLELLDEMIAMDAQALGEEFGALLAATAVTGGRASLPMPAGATSTPDVDALLNVFGADITAAAQEMPATPVAAAAPVEAAKVTAVLGASVTTATAASAAGASPAVADAADTATTTVPTASTTAAPQAPVVDAAVAALRDAIEAGVYFKWVEKAESLPMRSDRAPSFDLFNPKGFELSICESGWEPRKVKSVDNFIRVLCLYGFYRENIEGGVIRFYHSNFHAGSKGCDHEIYDSRKRAASSQRAARRAGSATALSPRRRGRGGRRARPRSNSAPTKRASLGRRRAAVDGSGAGAGAGGGIGGSAAAASVVEPTGAPPAKRTRVEDNAGAMMMSLAVAAPTPPSATMAAGAASSIYGGLDFLRVLADAEADLTNYFMYGVSQTAVSPLGLPNAPSARALPSSTTPPGAFTPTGFLA
uniref:Uncharacterized protein n=1 Tax=Bicosoecida sp. CB-2014 TaxID=1486930 RepID=A0A7S1C684_9STRA|mmetsp:Transcript_1326/g.4162  ORF Transcript_1326/g.4162 Transcript_1326/m.4162 type:complete len:545 (+) Transcript_1326:250-1884(+)